MEINVEVTGGIDLATVVGRRRYFNGEHWDDTDETVGDRVAQIVADSFIRDMDLTRRADLVKAVMAHRDVLIRERLVPLVERAFTEGIQRTNAYGQPTGPVVTLTELIIEEAQKLLVGRKDSWGKNETLVSKIIYEQVNRVMSKELTEAVAAEKEKVVAAVRAQAADLVTKAIEGALKR